MSSSLSSVTICLYAFFLLDTGEMPTLYFLHLAQCDGLVCLPLVYTHNPLYLVSVEPKPGAGEWHSSS